MELDVAARMTREVMDDHGLHDWRFSFDNARRRAGVTKYREKTICLSKVLIPLYTRNQVLDVVLHEVAHALVGPGHHHDAVWKAQALAIGASPSARLKGMPQPPAPWMGECPQGHRVERYRRPRMEVSCSICSTSFDDRYLIRWRRREGKSNQ